MKSLANEFFSTMADGAKKHQSAHAADYDLIVNGIKNETDLAEQVGLVEQMIARRVNAIVIAPADSKALVTVLKRAQDAGIAIDDASLRAPWLKTITNVVSEATLTLPTNNWMQQGGRSGRHSEHLGHLLSELQSMQRTFPGATW